MIKKLTEIEAKEMIREAIDTAKRGKILDAIHDKFKDEEIERVMQIGDRLFHSGYIHAAIGSSQLAHRMVITNLMASGVIPYEFLTKEFELTDEHKDMIENELKRIMMKTFEDGLSSPNEEDYE